MGGSRSICAGCGRAISAAAWVCVHCGAVQHDNVPAGALIVRLGRETDNDIVVDASYSDTSKYHAEVLSERGGAMRIRDCDSRNGTYVNQRRVYGAVPIVPGDELLLGKAFVDVSRLLAFARNAREGAAPREVSAAPAPKIAEPVAKPAVPPTKPVVPQAKPVVPQAKPVVPQAKPVVPAAKPQARPAVPIAKPVEPVAKPVEPIAKPVEPVAKPVEPVAKPVEPVAKPVEPIAKPVEPIADPPKPRSIVGHLRTGELLPARDPAERPASPRLAVALGASPAPAAASAPGDERAPASVAAVRKNPRKPAASRFIRCSCGSVRRAGDVCKNCGEGPVPDE
jgi:hypothetical protein